MSNFFNLIKNIFIKDNSEKIPEDISGKSNLKCGNDNNNLDSSNTKKDDKKNIIKETFNYSPEITYSRTPLLYYNNSFNQCWN